MLSVNRANTPSSVKPWASSPTAVKQQQSVLGRKREVTEREHLIEDMCNDCAAGVWARPSKGEANLLLPMESLLLSLLMDGGWSPVTADENSGDDDVGDTTTFHSDFSRDVILALCFGKLLANRMGEVVAGHEPRVRATGIPGHTFCGGVALTRVDERPLVVSPGFYALTCPNPATHPMPKATDWLLRRSPLDCPNLPLLLRLPFPPNALCHIAASNFPVAMKSVLRKKVGLTKYIEVEDDKMRRKPLAWAAFHGAEQTFDIILRHMEKYEGHIDFGVRDRIGRTIFDLAVRGGSLHIVETLLNHPEASAEGTIPLFSMENLVSAGLQDSPSVFRLLWSRSKPYVSAEDASNTLKMFINKVHMQHANEKADSRRTEVAFEVLTALLSIDGVDPNNVCASGSYVECVAHSSLLLKTIVRHPQFVALSTEQGTSGMINAAAAGAIDSIEFLVQVMKVDVNVSLRGGAPLHSSAYFGRLETVKALLAMGADPTAKDCVGMIPAEVAELGAQQNDALEWGDLSDPDVKHIFWQVAKVLRDAAASKANDEADA